jgi:hypothetical protein
MGATYGVTFAGLDEADAAEHELGPPDLTRLVVRSAEEARAHHERVLTAGCLHEAATLNGSWSIVACRLCDGR